MSNIFAFQRDPTGPVMTEGDFWKAATTRPFSMAQSLGQGAIEGFLGSPGIGTYARELQLPDAVPQVEPDGALGAQMQNPPGYVPTTPDQQQRAAAVRQNQQAIQQQNDAQYGALTEEQQKDSPDFRPNVGVQPGMTAARQAALAEWNDAKEYRARVLDRSNHGLLRFAGGVFGSMTDPVNYLPIIGPEVRAAAVARWGFAGAAGITAADAALNAGLASAATAPVRAGLGDDVSWQAIVSQMAMAALGGAVVGGAIHGAGRAVEAWSNDRANNSLENVMKSRAILNEAIDGVARGEDIALSPAARTEIARVGDETAAHVQQSEAATPAPAKPPETPEGAKLRAQADNIASMASFADDQRAARAEWDQVTALRQRADEIDAGAVLLPNAPNDLRAAIRLPDGTVKLGEPGQSHSDLAEKLSEGVVDAMKVEDLGFADVKNGKFLSGPESLSKLPEYGLRAADLHGLEAERTSPRVNMASDELARAQQVAAERLPPEATEQPPPEGDAGGAGDEASLPVEHQYSLGGGGPKEHTPGGDGPTVFHGTLSDFRQFDLAHLGKESDATRSKLGFFFTDNPNVARTYASADRYAALKRILPEGVVDGIAKVSDGVLKLFGAKPGRQEGRVISAKILPGKQFVYELPAGVKDFDPAEVGAAIAHAKERGYDSIMIKNMVDDGYGGTTGQASNVHVVFRPEQIQILDHGLPAAPAPKPDGVYRGNALKPQAPRTLDHSAPRTPEPDPAVKQAEARVAKPTDLKAVATELGVNPDTGEFREQADIAQLKAEWQASGADHTEDLAELAEADTTFENGQAYGEALKAAFTCVVGAAA